MTVVLAPCPRRCRAATQAALDAARQVVRHRRWYLGLPDDRPLPAWLPDALVLAWHGRALRLNRAGVRARAVAQRLAESLEDELDNAPRM